MEGTAHRIHLICTWIWRVRLSRLQKNLLDRYCGIGQHDDIRLRPVSQPAIVKDSLHLAVVVHHLEVLQDSNLKPGPLQVWKQAIDYQFCALYFALYINFERISRSSIGWRGMAGHRERFKLSREDY